MEEQLRRTQRPLISNWEKMKERLKEKYLPIDYEQMMFEEMLQLRQGSLTVDQYTDRFHELTVRSRIAETDQQTLARYRNGLCGELYKEMLIARLIAVEEAYQLALRIEKQLGNTTGRKVMPMEGKLGHSTNFSIQKPHLPYDRPGGSILGEQRGKAKVTSDGPQCYKCKGFGHYVVVCPTRDKKLAFICEKELTVMSEAEGEKTKELATEEEEHLDASDLPSCVIHRILTRNKIELKTNQEWLRTNIFNTRLEHGGRALNVIIDNGSGINVISETAVERLHLKTETHPSPYRISWVNEHNSVLVKHRCLVQFSLGREYVDEAWCDIIPMTVCHMLLG